MSKPEHAGQSALTWARRMELGDGRTISRLSRIGVDELATAMFLRLSEPWRELAAAWTLWTFVADDELDGYADANAAGARAQQVMAFEGGPLGKALHDIVGRFADLSTVAHHRNQLRSEIRAYLEGCVWEARNRGSRAIPSSMRYREMRPDTGATRPFLRIALAATAVTRELEERPEARGILAAAAWLPCLANDLVSFEKEAAAGDFHNAVILLMKETGLTAERAREKLVAAYDRELEAFDDGLSMLRGSSLSALQADAIGDVVHGAEAWLMKSTRYGNVSTEASRMRPPSSR